MKKLAARDFEDLLQVCNQLIYCARSFLKKNIQCAIPAFEHLFEHEHNERLMKLLFRLAQWHALAKLRLHTEPTIVWLEQTTTEVGKLMREFRDKSTTKFATFELPREQDARARRQAATQSRRTEQSSDNQPKQSMFSISESLCLLTSISQQRLRMYLLLKNHGLSTFSHTSGMQWVTMFHSFAGLEPRIITQLKW